jgi:ADP-heptose:LPS heptosyltransferase
MTLRHFPGRYSGTASSRRTSALGRINVPRCGFQIMENRLNNGAWAFTSLFSKSGANRKPDIAFGDIHLKRAFHTRLIPRRGIETLAIFRALQLGDMLCAVPALRALRAALPGARITLIGLPWAEQFALRFNSYIDDFVAFPGHPAFPEQPVQENLVPGFYQAMRSRNFDLALQMHGSGQVSNQIVSEFGANAVAGYAATGGSTIDAGRFIEYPANGAEPLRLLKLTEFLGAPSMGTHLEFPLTERDAHELDESGLFAAPALVAGNYICIHPGASIRDKCWPPQRFAEVADRLCDEFGLPIVLTGSAKETDLTAAVAAHMRNKAVDAAAPLSIGAMAVLMSRACLLICNDTGVSHIAAGLTLPSVVIFSKANMERWSPLDRTRHRCIWDPEGQHAAAVLEQARTLLLSEASAV